VHLSFGSLILSSCLLRIFKNTEEFNFLIIPCNLIIGEDTKKEFKKRKSVSIASICPFKNFTFFFLSSSPLSSLHLYTFFLIIIIVVVVIGVMFTCVLLFVHNLIVLFPFVVLFVASSVDAAAGVPPLFRWTVSMVTAVWCTGRTR